MLCISLVGVGFNPQKAKMTWTDVCRPQDEGGLGLRSIKEVNMVVV